MENTKEGNISRTNLNLDDLPIDVLECIFKFCQLSELGRLSAVCKRFNSLIEDEFLWRKRYKTLITNQTSSEIILRSSKLFSPKEKCRIATNWKAGFYVEKTYRLETKYMPWLVLEADQVWLSKGNSIYAYERTHNGVHFKHPRYSLEAGHKDDIRNFVKAHDMIFSCGQDWRICGWSAKSGKLVFRNTQCHESDIHSIDVNQQILVTGSKDATVKIWRLHDDLTGCDLVSTTFVDDRTWCVAINPMGDRVACGCAGSYDKGPLHFYDLESGVETTLLDCYTFKRGAAIFDLKWESENVLITCGYDSFIRLFDLRVGGCVGMWMDPFDAAGYCLATDNLYCVLCGTSHHGRVQLWDKRMLCSVQAFFSKMAVNSPVYSVSFDPSQMFIALDTSLNVMDFSGKLLKDSIRQNYRSHWADEYFWGSEPIFMK